MMVDFMDGVGKSEREEEWSDCRMVLLDIGSSASVCPSPGLAPWRRSGGLGGHVVGFFVKVAVGLNDEGTVVGAGHVDEGFVAIEHLTGRFFVA